MKVTDKDGREQELTPAPEFRRCALYIPADMWADYCAHGARWGTTPSDVARMALTAGHKATVDHSDRGAGSPGTSRPGRGRGRPAARAGDARSCAGRPGAAGRLRCRRDRAERR